MSPYDVYTLDFEVLSDLAARNVFDLYRKASFYIIVSSVDFFGAPIVKQFEDTRYGYSQAYAWMKKILGKEWEED